MSVEVLHQSQDSHHQRVLDIGAAVVNSEAKAAFHVAMLEGVGITKRDLQKLFLGIQDPEHPAWPCETPYNWCEASFTPVGLTTEPYAVSEAGGLGFAKTKYGRYWGDAMAGRGLELSAKYPGTSLLLLFGRTSTSAESETRAIENRLDIFATLVDYDTPIRMSDISQRPDPEQLSAHAITLALNGIVGRQSRSFADPIVEYGLGATPFDSLRLRPKCSRLPSDIVHVLKRSLDDRPSGSITSPEIIAGLVELQPSYGQQDQYNLKKNISAAMRTFIKLGAVAYVGNFDNINRSQVGLDDQQRQLIKDCLHVFDRFFAHDKKYLAEGREIADAMVVDTESINNLIAKARRHSPDANRIKPEERLPLMHSVVDPGEAVTTEEIVQRLFDKGHQISANSVRRILNGLEKDGDFRRDTKSKTSKSQWSRSPSDD